MLFQLVNNTTNYSKIKSLNILGVSPNLIINQDF